MSNTTKRKISWSEILKKYFKTGTESYGIINQR